MRTKPMDTQPSGEGQGWGSWVERGKQEGKRGALVIVLITKNEKGSAVANYLIFSTSVYSRDFNLCLEGFHIHIKNRSGDAVLTFKCVQVTIIPEEVGVYMSGKQYDKKIILPPFIHLFNTYLSVTILQPCFLSNGIK